MKFTVDWSKFGTLPLKRIATIRSSNVDKLVAPNEIPIRLCNYVDVYYNEQIHPGLDFTSGSADRSEIERFGLKRGDVIITKDSETPDDIAVSALVTDSSDDLVCGYHLALLRSDSAKSVPAFLYYVLKSRPVRDAFTVRAQGVTRFGLTLSGIGSVLCPNPNLDVQKEIVGFLDRETTRIDQLVEKKKRQIALLEDKKVSQASELVTRGLDPKAAMAPTGIEWLPSAPSHWRAYRLAAIFREIDECGEEGLPVLSVSINWGISDRELNDGDRHRIVNQIADKAAYKRVRPGDLVYNMMRAWQGAFGVTAIDGLVSPAYVVARPKEAIHSPYFEPLLRTPMCIEEFRRASKGIADFRQRLYWEHFRQVRVALPPLAEQIEIANRIQGNAVAIDRVIAPINTSIERLQELRSALITAAVTGQIDVTSWERSGQTEEHLDALEVDLSISKAAKRTEARA